MYLYCCTRATAIINGRNINPTIGIGSGRFHNDQHYKQRKITRISAFLPRSIGAPSSSLNLSDHHQPTIRCLHNPQSHHVVNHNERVTIAKLKQKKHDNIPITVVTTHDFPSALHADKAGIDICLVDDSALMVAHGYDTNRRVSFEEMLVHYRAVARGARCSLLVGDLPSDTFNSSTHQAVDTAVKVLKEGGMDAVKLEVRSPPRLDAAKAIVGAGIAVMGCVRLETQGCVDSAIKVMETAKSLQDAGCFSVVLESVPAPVAAAISSMLEIPTVGFGSGSYCSGQVLAYHDMLTMLQNTDHIKVAPEFCKQYGNVGNAINEALLKYREEVTLRKFPCCAYTPYNINVKEFSRKLQNMKNFGAARIAEQKDVELKMEKAIKKNEMEERKNNTQFIHRACQRTISVMGPAWLG